MPASVENAPQDGRVGVAKGSRDSTLDLLRILAALVVVAFHYIDRGPRVGEFPVGTAAWLVPWATYGYLGVHLFFMISGYVILLSAERASPAAFVASRVSRLLPAFWIAATLTSVLALALDARQFIVSPRDFALNLTLVPDWFGATMIDGVYWSLSVEIHFYLLVLLALLSIGLGRTEWIVVAWLALCCIEWLVLPSWTLQSWFCTRWAPLFCGGILFYRLHSRGDSIGRWVLVLIAGMLAGAMAWIEAGGSSPARPGLEPAVSAAIVIAMFVLLAIVRVAGLRVRQRAWITLGAALSYPVYLVHQNIGYMLIGWLERHAFSPPAAFGVCLGLVIALSWLIHRYVERVTAAPLRSGISRLLGRRSAGAAAMREPL